ncbi:MAG: glycosyltransferase family 39 protein, partial [Chloroflexota bacterium]
ETFLPYNPHFEWRPFDYSNGAAVHLHHITSASGSQLFAPSAGAVRWLRLFSMIFGALTIWGTFLIGQVIFPQRPRLALLAAAFVAIHPTLLGISATLHNDILVTLLTTFSLLWMVCYLERDRFPQVASRWGLIGIGLLLSMAILTKLSGLILAPMMGATLLIAGLQTKRWRQIFWDGGIILLIVCLLAGWWYLRNLLTYRSPLPLSNVMQQIFPHVYRTEAYTFGLFRAEFLRQSYETFWGAFGYNHLLIPLEWTAQLWRILVIILFLGVAWLLWRQFVAAKKESITADRDQIIRRQLLLLGLTILLTFLSVAQLSISMRGAGQARYYLPALPPLAV